MKLSPIHQTPEEKQSYAMQDMCSMVEKNTQEIEKMSNAIGNLRLTDLALSLVTITQNLIENKAKLEEVKSAQLATNITLKKVIKVIQEIPQTDMSNTNNLLKDMITELKKPLKTTLNIL